jgi:hypothetical protein
VVEEVVLDQ